MVYILTLAVTLRIDARKAKMEERKWWEGSGSYLNIQVMVGRWRLGLGGREGGDKKDSASGYIYVFFTSYFEQF